MEQNNSQLRLQLLHIIWFALLMGQLIYLALPFINPGMVRAAGTGVPGLELVITTMAASSLLVGWILPSRLWKISGAQLPKGREPSEPELLMKYFTPFIIRLALFEAVAMSGLIMRIQGHDPKNALMLSGTAMVCHFLALPNLDKIKHSLSQ